MNIILLIIISSFISDNSFCSTNRKHITAQTKTSSKKYPSVDDILKSNDIDNLSDKADNKKTNNKKKSHTSDSDDDYVPILSQEEIDNTKNFLQSMKNPAFRDKLSEENKKIAAGVEKQSPEVQKHLQEESLKSIKLQKQRINKTSVYLKRKLESLQKKLKNEHDENEETQKAVIQVLQNNQQTIATMGDTLTGLTNQLSNGDSDGSNDNTDTDTSNNGFWDTFKSDASAIKNWFIQQSSGVIGFLSVAAFLGIMYKWGNTAFWTLLEKVSPNYAARLSSWLESRRAAAEAAEDEKIITSYQKMQSRGTNMSEETTTKYKYYKYR